MAGCTVYIANSPVASLSPLVCAAAMRSSALEPERSVPVVEIASFSDGRVRNEEHLDLEFRRAVDVRLKSIAKPPCSEQFHDLKVAKDDLFAEFEGVEDLEDWTAHECLFHRAGVCFLDQVG